MFRPMLAPSNDPLKYEEYFDELKFPLLVSPKYDGIRAIVKNGQVRSRTFKLIPSLQVQEDFGYLEHFDGELIEGKHDENVYNRTQSHVMSEDKPGDVSYHIFDYTPDELLEFPYHERLKQLKFEIRSRFAVTPEDVKLVPQIHCKNLDDLLAVERFYLNAGFEGVIMRDPEGRYKNGRGTWREGLIYKLKRFQDSEAIIVDFIEGQLNKNIQEKDELGYAKRSTAKDGMVPADTLGKFIVDWNGDILEIAPGNFDHEQRKEIWNNREQYFGYLLKFRYFQHGIKDKPRFPRAVGFRSIEDI